MNDNHNGIRAFLYKKMVSKNTKRWLDNGKMAKVITHRIPNHINGIIDINFGNHLRLSLLRF